MLPEEISKLDNGNFKYLIHTRLVKRLHYCPNELEAEPLLAVLEGLISNWQNLSEIPAVDADFHIKYLLFIKEFTSLHKEKTACVFSRLPTHLTVVLTDPCTTLKKLEILDPSESRLMANSCYHKRVTLVHVSAPLGKPFTDRYHIGWPLVSYCMPRYHMRAPPTSGCPALPTPTTCSRVKNLFSHRRSMPAKCILLAVWMH